MDFEDKGLSFQLPGHLELERFGCRQLIDLVVQIPVNVTGGYYEVVTRSLALQRITELIPISGESRK